MLEQRVRARTAELELSLAENEKINRALSESEEKFRLLSENAYSAIILAHAEGNVKIPELWRPERMFGYTSAEMLGRNAHLILIPERYRERMALGLVRFAKSGFANALNKSLEIEGVRKDGSEISVDLSLASFRIRGAWNSIAVLRDITERKRLVAEMAYRRALLHAVSVAAKELLTAPSIEVAMATALKTVGEAARADRMIVFELQAASRGSNGSQVAIRLEFAESAGNI